MKKIRINFLFLGLILITNYSLAQNVEYETKKNQLLSPSFEELQSEFVWMTIINYANMPDEIINESMDRHFNRIQFMSFSEDEK